MIPVAAGAFLERHAFALQSQPAEILLLLAFGARLLQHGRPPDRRSDDEFLQWRARVLRIQCAASLFPHDAGRSRAPPVANAPVRYAKRFQLPVWQFRLPRGELVLLFAVDRVELRDGQFRRRWALCVLRRLRRVPAAVPAP